MDGDQSFRSEDTRGLFVRLGTLALASPLVCALALYGYALYFGIPLDRRFYRQAIFVIWLATLFVLAVAALRGRRGVSRAREPEGEEPSLFRVRSSRTPAEKWEHRSARSLVFELYLRAVLVPLLGIILAVGILLVSGHRLTRPDAVTIAASGWLGGLAIAVLSAIRSRKTTLGEMAGGGEQEPDDEAAE